MSRHAGATLVAAAALALMCANLAAGAATFHNTEDWTYETTLVPRGPGKASGSFTAKITIVRGEPSAKIVWKLTYRGLSGEALEANVYYGRPGGEGPIAVRLCVLCRQGATGRTTFPTGKPWFGRGRTVGFIPALSAKVITDKRPGGEIASLLEHHGWMAYYS